MFIGPPRSGKGTTIRVLEELIGKHNTAGPSLQDLSDRFGLEGLVGKTLATLKDARATGGKFDNIGVATERLLNISGGDSVDVQRKNKPSLMNVQLTTKFIIASNCTPKLNDEAAVLASRVIALLFGQSFLGKEIPNLTEELCEELPGILNWALEGWDNLHAAGKFKQPESGKPIIAELTKLQNNVVAFVEEQCYFGDWIGKETLHKIYQQWCRDSGYVPASIVVFSRNLKSAARALGHEIRDYRPGSGDDRDTAFRGICHPSCKPSSSR
jgi:putative DNA primase/helicase